MKRMQITFIFSAILSVVIVLLAYALYAEQPVVLKSPTEISANAQEIKHVKLAKHNSKKSIRKPVYKMKHPVKGVSGVKKQGRIDV